MAKVSHSSSYTAKQAAIADGGKEYVNIHVYKDPFEGPHVDSIADAAYVVFPIGGNHRRIALRNEGDGTWTEVCLARLPGSCIYEVFEGADCVDARPVPHWTLDDDDPCSS